MSCADRLRAALEKAERYFAAHYGDLGYRMNVRLCLRALSVDRGFVTLAELDALEAAELAVGFRKRTPDGRPVLTPLGRDALNL